jgi:hypothetical protein
MENLKLIKQRAKNYEQNSRVRARTMNRIQEFELEL